MTATEALAPPARYVTEIPLDELHPVEHNRDLGPREGLEGMAATMRVLGVLEPLLVRSDPGNGYEIIAGARRHAAARIAELATVPCLIENDRDDQQVELARAIENLQRKDLDPIEEAQVYERLTGPPFNLTMEAIGDSVGRTKSHISKRCSLLTLPAPAREAVADGRIPITTALAMTPLARDQKRIDALVDALPDPDATDGKLERQRQELDRKIADESRERALAEKISVKKIELDNEGETVVEYPPHGIWAGTGYRVCRDGEPHEAIAVTTDLHDDVKVVHVTTQPLPDDKRHHPPKPPGDVGFVEQARRQREKEATDRADARRDVARTILDAPGLDQELTTYVLDTVIGISLAGEADLAYDTRGTVRDLLDLEDDVQLLDYAHRSNLTRMRTAAAACMAGTEETLRRPRMNKLPPGAWAPPPVDADEGDFDEHADTRRYLRLLERHGLELDPEEGAAMVAVSAGNADGD